MDWIELQKQIRTPGDITARARKLFCLYRVLDGTQYDDIIQPFYKERLESGEYVPMRERRPSVKSGVCALVVEDAVSLLFSEAHWPTIQVSAGEEVQKELNRVVAAIGLQEKMFAAGLAGSVGSVAIICRVIDGRPSVEVKRSTFLTPKFHPLDPDVLVALVEEFPTTAAHLQELGYAGMEREREPYLFRRSWDADAETLYVPRPLREADGSTSDPVVDEERTVVHGLGMMNAVWIRNLPGGDGPDGRSTFERAIDVEIVGDYQLSQVDRGLIYSSDPTLVINDPGVDGVGKPGTAAPTVIRSASNALTLPPEATAKLLEITGAGAATSLKLWEHLREIALEKMHGNRSHGDKLSAAQSGRAMEMMCQGLIWIADRLRLSYGQGGLMSVLRIIGAMSKMRGGLEVDGKPVPPLDCAGLSLIWPPWFQPTYADAQTLAQAIGNLRSAGAISPRTAVVMAQPASRVPDADAEMSAIEAAQAAEDARLLKLGAQVQNKTTTPV